MINRLKNLPSGQEFEAKISDNKTSPELKNHLENIKKILKDNPSKEEITSAKNFLDSLSSLKTAFEKSKIQSSDETKQKLDKLSGELGIYTETQMLIEGLRTKEKGVEVDNGKIEFGGLFKGIKNDMLELPKLAISGYIEGNEAFKKFNAQTKENLKIGLTAKIINSGFVDSLMGGFSSKIKGYSKAVSGDNIMESVGNIIDSDKSEIGKIDIKAAIKAQIENHGSIIIDFVKKNENHPKLNEFLKNSKNIEQITPESNLDNIKFATPKDEKEAFNQLQSKIAEYNKQILVAENAKNQIFDQVSKMPSFISDAIVGFIKFLCGLSFIGDFIKKFLGLKGNTEDEIEKELKGEFEARKSINKLVSYGIKKGEKGEIIESKNEPAISILKDKDLSELEVKKIKDSIVGMKNNGVDIMKSDFWFNMLEKNEIQFLRTDADNKGTVVIEKIPANLIINDKDFDKNKCPNEEFYKKINQILKINNIPSKTETTSPAKSEDKTQSTTPESTKTTETNEGQITYAEHESWKEEEKREKTKPILISSHWKKTTGESGGESSTQALDKQKNNKGLPQEIGFNKKTQTLVIDGKKYGISATNTYIPISIDSIEYDKVNGEISISGSLGTEHDKKTLNQEEVGKYFAEIKKLNQGGDNLKIKKGDIDIVISALS